MHSHPNAASALGTGGAVAAILWLLSVLGVHVPEPPLEVSIFLGSLAAALVLAIGRRGLVGIGHLIWRGQS